MSNTILSRPLRPLSSSLNSCLRSTNATTPSAGAITNAAAAKNTSSSGSTSHAASTITPPLTQRRYAATTRRHNKFLKSVPSAPIFTPHQSVAADTIIYNPPSSAPNVYHTPLKFLPANDRRRQLAALQARAVAAQSVAHGASPVTRTGTQLSAPSGYNATLNSLASSYGNISSSPSPSSHPSNSNPAQKLPPPLRQPYDKKYHLTETDVAEIRRLRASDPVTWSRQKLADKFECSPFFVGLVAPAPEHAQRKADEVEELKKRWGPRRRAAREDRKRRKEMWGRGA